MKLCVIKKCRWRKRRRNKDHYDCCYCFGRRLKCRINRSYPFCQCSLKKIKIDEDDVIMMDPDFDFGVGDSHGTGGYSISVGNSSKKMKLSGLDTKAAENKSFYAVLSKMDRDERQNAARLRRNHAYVPLVKYIERLYKTIRLVYFNNSNVRSSANIQTSKRMLSLNVVERLGRSTRMCCADESAATAGEPCVEEIFFLQGDRSEDQNDENCGKNDGDRTNSTRRVSDDYSSSSDEDDGGINSNRSQSGNKPAFTDDMENQSGKNIDSTAKFENGSNVGENLGGGKSQGAPEKSSKKNTNTVLDLTDEYYQQKIFKHDRSFVLDLCRDTSQPHNVRFEAPNWRKKYMLSLKPIGLCALLCGNAGVDSTDSLEIDGDDMHANLARAVAHRSWWDNDSALKQLAYAIGFNDADLQIYRRRSRIHVIAPSMEKEEEDRLIRPHRWITTIPQLRTYVFNCCRRFALKTSRSAGAR